MTNAKEEILKLLTGRKIKCAKIIIDGEDEVILKVEHTPKEYKEFLDMLDFDYDAGGCEYKLEDSTVWFKNNTWAKRRDNMGCEWWSIISLPPIPKDLIK